MTGDTDIVALSVAVGGSVDHASQAKVGDLDDKLVGDEHITSRQVAVYYLQQCIVFIISYSRRR